MLVVETPMRGRSNLGALSNLYMYSGALPQLVSVILRSVMLGAMPSGVAAFCTFVKLVILNCVMPGTMPHSSDNTL